MEIGPDRDDPSSPHLAGMAGGGISATLCSVVCIFPIGVSRTLTRLSNRFAVRQIRQSAIRRAALAEIEWFRAEASHQRFFGVRWLDPRFAHRKLRHAAGGLRFGVFLELGCSCLELQLVAATLRWFYSCPIHSLDLLLQLHISHGVNSLQHAWGPLFHSAKPGRCSFSLWPGSSFSFCSANPRARRCTPRLLHRENRDSSSSANGCGRSNGSFIV